MRSARNAEAPQAALDQGAREACLTFFLRGVIEVVGEAAKTARQIPQLCEQHCAVTAAQLGCAAGNGHKVLESLFDRAIVAANDVQKMTGYARNRRLRHAPSIDPFNETGPSGEATEAPK
jgi:hypothetical protein